MATLDHYHAVREKCERSPAALTEADFVVLAELGCVGEETRARKAKTWALANPPLSPEQDVEREVLVRQLQTKAAAARAQTSVPRLDIRDGDDWPTLIERNQKVPVTFRMIGAFFKVLTDTFRKEQHHAAALEARIVALEARPAGVAAKYCGVWREGAHYDEGSLTTRHGALWIAKCPTTDKPGTPSWQLIVKSGDA
jgi:hypothetical protein